MQGELAQQVSELLRRPVWSFSKVRSSSCSLPRPYGRIRGRQPRLGVMKAGGGGRSTCPAHLFLWHGGASGWVALTPLHEITLTIH